jgi:hypothetical protein
MGLTHSRGPPLTNKIYHDSLPAAANPESLVKAANRGAISVRFNCVSSAANKEHGKLRRKRARERETEKEERGEVRTARAAPPCNAIGKSAALFD